MNLSLLVFQELRFSMKVDPWSFAHCHFYIWYFILFSFYSHSGRMKYWLILSLTIYLAVSTMVINSMKSHINPSQSRFSILFIIMLYWLHMILVLLLFQSIRIILIIGYSQHNGNESSLMKVMWLRMISTTKWVALIIRTILHKAVVSLRGEIHWIISGTPLQNTVNDLFSLFRFLRYEPWCYVRFF